MNITGSDRSSAILPCSLIVRNFNEEGKKRMRVNVPVDR